MRQFLAILSDSFVETLDRKSLIILAAIAIIPIVFCAGISFDAQSMEQVLTEQTDELGRWSFKRRAGRVSIDAEVESVREIDTDLAEAHELSEDVVGGNLLTLKFADPAQLDEYARTYYFRKGDYESEEAVPRKIGDQLLAEAILEARYAEFGFDDVDAVQDLDDPSRYHIGCRAAEPTRLQAAHSMSFLFGLIETGAMEDFSVGTVITLIQLGLAQNFVGFLGLLIAVIICAGFVPNMLQKGTLDLVLARPISREKLLLAKYLGGLWYVLLLTTFVVGGCWLGFVVGSGYSNPAFLSSIPALFGAFAVLHSVSTLMGVATRSTGVAALTALGVWGLSTIITTAEAVVDQVLDDPPEWATTGIDVIRTVLPNIQDFDKWNTKVIADANGMTGPMVRQMGLDQDLDIGLSLFTTALFTVAMLVLAVLMFRKRDY